ncbi:hypothetical protein ACTA71_010702 [Dictyostelium dimigraforme]
MLTTEMQQWKLSYGFKGVNNSSSKLLFQVAQQLDLITALFNIIPRLFQTLLKDPFTFIHGNVELVTGDGGKSSEIEFMAIKTNYIYSIKGMTTYVGFMNYMVDKLSLLYYLSIYNISEIIRESRPSSIQICPVVEIFFYQHKIMEITHY